MYKKQGSNFHTSSAGFTLLELMVAVIILAILAAIAMPMYSNYITKAKARSAQSDLVALSLVLESMYQRNLKYPDLAGGKTTTTDATKTYAGAWSPSTETFDYTIESVTATSYKLKAKGNDRNANCEMTLDNKNERKFEKTSGCGGLTSW
ncbi:type IV pilin protein [Acinetobacter indicus]|uniref:type IV pilin protein n=1 Tax=Acinetobacter indicus TaxID=756892 RepID=UPI0025761305|nr:type IV pilin protein [Acinetobacter indicus]MDM1287091.1 prepilin-type N-terminal cleavage/methylation domain-containing protein [Acinetobacter indicus]